jgi:sialidase-1
MKIISIAISILFLSCCYRGYRDVSRVFISGTEGYKIYRIPAIIRLPGGRLLAFAEGRLNGSNDFGNIDIVMKTSDDNGMTWSGLSVVADYDTLQAGNPAPVADLTDPAFPQGRIFLFYNTGNNHEGEVRKGKGLREVWYRTSTDEGQSWSDPVNITTQVHHPNMPGINPAYNSPEDWRSYANTPGHAVQFSEGIYKGRILVAANHSSGEPDVNWEDSASHDYYTDDHGLTFHLGADLPVPGSNEATAAEMSSGGLILNVRNQKGDIRERITAISRDGGETWDSIWFDKNLPDPVCEGSILSLGKKEGKTVLAFCNDADTVRRDNLTLRISYDEGRSWHMTIPVDRSTSDKKEGAYTAYSDIVSIPPTDIGILYERNNYSEIVFRLFKVEY